MTKKEFITELKDLGFSEIKFINATAPEYFFIILQHIRLSVSFVGKNNKEICIHVLNKKDLDFTHNVLLKKTDKIDEKILKTIKKMVNFFA